MADNDPSSCVILSDGFTCDVTITGAAYSTGATYDFGSLNNSPSDLSAPTFVMTVTDEGYTNGVLGTATPRVIYGTKVVRLPFPNEATLDETDTGTSLVIRVSLSEGVYADSKNGGVGTSGVDPTVSIAAGWCTSGANSNNAVTDLTCTNNSTLAYPNNIAQWAQGHTPIWRAVTSDATLGCISNHGHGLDSVYFTATDEHSNSINGLVTTKTRHQKSASGFYYESFDFTSTKSSFTDGDDITCNFIAYPLIGDESCILDTSLNTTSTDDCLGLTQITYRLATSSASIYVAATDHPTTPGNDSTGDGSTGTPYATIGKALSVVTEAAGKVSYIYAKDGGTTLGILGSTPAAVAATGCFIEVLPNPGDTVTLNRGATFIAYKATKLLYSGFTITGNNWLDGGNVASAKLWFEDCTLDPTTPNGTVGLGYRSEGCFFNNVVWLTRDNHAYFSGKIAYSYTGCDLQAGGILTCQATLVATKITGAGVDTVQIADNFASTLPLTHNILYLNNAFLNIEQSSLATVRINDNHAKSDVAFIGNIIEVVSGTQPALWVAADSNTLAFTNFIGAHNTIVGERLNFCYNDTGTVAVERSNIFWQANAIRSFNIKTDTFGTPNGNRIGNWAQVYGVNFKDNRYDGTVSSTFTGEYDGINVAYVVAKDTTYGQMGYTDEQSQDVGGGGNGNYLPDTGSVLKSTGLLMQHQQYDLYGTAL